MSTFARDSAIIVGNRIALRGTAIPKGSPAKELPVLTPDSITPADIARFESKVDRSGGPSACHPWTGYCNPSGYGQFRLGPRAELAHRVAYVIANGALPSDKPCVCHRCDTPPCCNGAHLFAGTYADNNADMAAKGRVGISAGDRSGMRLHPERHWSRHSPDVVARGDRHWSRTMPERVSRGSRVGSAKLTEADIPGIRAALAAKEGVVSIARRYGVSHPAISRIKAGESWAHVPTTPPHRGRADDGMASREED